nr:hypothetical protein [Saccharomonospora piscinae]
MGGELGRTDSASLSGDLWQVVGGQGDSQDDVIGVVDQLHSEVEQLEQAPEVFLRRVGKVEGQVGQRIEKSNVVGMRCTEVGLVVGVEFGDRRERCLLLCFQVVVAAAESLGERVVEITVLGLLQDRGLAAGEVGQDSLEALAFSLALPGGVMVESIEVGGKDAAAFWTEDSLGKEDGDGVEEGLLAKIDRFGMACVGVGTTTVVVLWPAHVVGAVVPVIAIHAPPAPAEHHAAQHVGTPGLGVLIEVVVCPRALPRLAPGVKFVVHPLRDQRLMGRLERPDPLDGVVYLAFPRSRGTAVENLVAGVLGVAQNLVHAGLAPGLAGALPAGWFG